jgi:glutamine synthetase
LWQSAPHVNRQRHARFGHLDEDRDFLKKGAVFTDDLIDAYIELKWEEVYAFEHTPHPIEFQMYYSV